MALADVAVKSACAVDPRAAVAAIPRRYNFAADILERNLEAGRAGKPVYIDPRGSWTYGQLAERVDRFGNVLRALGVRCEERILLALLDTIDWPTAFLGAIKAGVVPIPVNTLMTEDDYRFMLADSRAKVLVVSEALLPKFANLIGSSPDLMHVIVAGNERPRASPVRGFARAGRCAIRHRGDHARRHLLLALYLGLHRPAQGRGARACQSAAHRRSLRRRRARPERNRRVLFRGQAVFRLWARQRPDLSDGGRRHHHPLARPPDARRRRRDPAPASGDGVLRRADLLCRDARQPRRAQALGPEAAILRLRRRGAAAGCRAALEGALRRRRARRHRFDRDAPHLHFELSRRGEIRHDRQAGAGLRHPPGRRRRAM